MRYAVLITVLEIDGNGNQNAVMHQRYAPDIASSYPATAYAAAVCAREAAIKRFQIDYGVTPRWPRKEED